MMRSFALKLAVIAMVLHSAIVYAKSRAMSPQQYADFINRLDTAASTWQDQIKHLETISVPIDADKRQKLTTKIAIASWRLNEIKSKVVSEREHPTLALQITMSDTLTAVSFELNELIADVPDSAGKKAWEDAVRSIQQAISDFGGPLHQHIIDKAYDLEDQLEECHAQARK